MQEILKRKKRMLSLATATLLASMLITLVGSAVIYAAKPAPVLLDPKTIPKWANKLVVPPVFTGTAGSYNVEMVADQVQILPGPNLTPLPGGGFAGKTTVWGYKGDAVAVGSTIAAAGTSLPGFFWSPSATFEAVKGVPTTVNWINSITAKQPFAVDPTLYWANPWKNYDPALAFPDGDAFSKTGALGGAFLPYPPGYDGTAATFPPYSLNAQNPVALVPHLHGAEVPGQFDGGPESWWTAAGTGGTSGNLKGPNYNSYATAAEGAAIYWYPNNQEPNTLWYHDHALGITRLNVMSGLAGFYLLRDGGPYDGQLLSYTNLDEYLTATFKHGIQEIPLAIQDRSFTPTGQLWFPTAGLNPTIHPYWMPEFFGNTIMVNGLVWPYLEVTPGWYRFRLLDGSNARFYTLSFDNRMPFTVIGADGGYLQSKATVNSITIAPGERADILVQFTPAMVGQNIILKNTAKAPFPNGANVDPLTTGQIMQFRVMAAGSNIPCPGVPNNPTPPLTAPVPTTSFSLASLPAILNQWLVPATPGVWPSFPDAVTSTKYITLNEVMGAAGPIMVMINGQYYHAPSEPATGQGPTVGSTVLQTPVPAGTSPYTSVSTLGATEEWVIINLTADTHPIHLHLVTFQLVSRQPFQAAKYQTAWLLQQTDPITKNPLVPPFPEYYEPIYLDPLPYLQSPNGVLAAPGTGVLPTEMGWKDTIQMNPGEVTRIRVRFLSQDGASLATTLAPYTPTGSPGYVYHCHIIDHEDNEMMRPFMIK